jgi:hypothetical protein
MFFLSRLFLEVVMSLAIRTKWILTSAALAGAMLVAGCADQLGNGATPTAVQQQSSDNSKGTPDIGNGGTGTAGTGAPNSGSAGTGASGASGTGVAGSVGPGAGGR